MSILEDAFLLRKSGGIYYEGARIDIQRDFNYLFVGLGGTGADALIRVKNQIYNRMKLPVDPNTKLPVGEVPENVGFLAFDTDENTKYVHYGNTKLASDGSEYVPIGANDASAWKTVLDKIKSDKKNGMEYAQWLHDTVEPKGGSVGAGGRRAVGRAGFFNNYDDITSKISDKLTKLSLANNTATNIKIFLFTGISGGTGSGNFIDMAYLLRRIGISFKPDCQVFGYIFMPDVNLASGGKESDLKSNAFATLKEYDYLEENGQNRGFKFVRSYKPSGAKISDDYPLDFCHIVNCTDDSGRAHTKDEVYSSVAESVFSFIEGETGGGMGFTPGFQSLYDNITAYLLSNILEAPIPAFYEYLSIGSASKKIPYLEINTLVACRMFDKLQRDVFDNKVTKQTFSEDLNSLGLGVGEDKIQDVLTAYLEEKNPKVHRLTSKEYTYEQIWESNVAYKHAYDDAQKYQDAMNSCAGTTPTDLETKLRDFLKSSFKDKNRGPIYLANLIYGEGEDQLLALIEQKKKYFSDICNQQISRLADVKRDLDDCYDKGAGLSKFNLIGRANALNDYLSLLKSWRTQQMTVDKYDNLAEVCDKLIKIYKKYYDNILKPMRDSLIEVRNIFSENLNYLEVKKNEALTAPDKSIIIDAFDFEAKYRDKFNECVDKAEDDFLTKLLENMSKWIRCDIDNVDTKIVQNPDIPGFLSNFISDCFNSIYATLTMEDIFEAFLAPGQEVKDYAYSIIKALYDQAFPLFKRSGNHIVDPYITSILSVPSNCPKIISAANMFQETIGPSLIVKDSVEVNCVSIIKLKAGYSLYSNALMEDLEDKYNSYRSSNLSQYLHLDYHWLQTMPSPVVELSWVGAHKDPFTHDRNEEYRKKFDRCYEHKLIDKVKNQTIAFLLEADPSVDLSKVKLVGDIKERTDTYRSLEHSLWNKNVIQRFQLDGMGVYSNNGTEEGQLKNIKENVIRFDDVCAKLDEQCQRLDRLEELHKQIEYPQLFANALLCDLIVYEKYEDSVFLLHQKNDPLRFTLIDGGTNLKSIDINSANYYYDIYEALYPVLPNSAGGGKTWAEQIRINWDAQRQKLIDEKEAVRIKNLIGKYANLFRNLGDSFKNKARTTVDPSEKARYESIADFYLIAFDSLGFTYKKYFA